MADSGAEARIRDLKRRLELEPGSRLFVSLAEEYRKAGRLADALLTLQKGLLTHPHYLSAQVALGRAYLETGLIAEAIATFSKVLLVDRGNLVSAKSLADIYLSRGESVEAVKKYKLYRALSGDRNVDAIIEQLEREHAPPPPGARGAAPPPPPPTFYEQKVPAPGRRSRTLKAAETAPPARVEDPFDVTSVSFEPEEPSTAAAGEPDPFPVASRDLPLFTARQTPSPPPAPEQDVVTRALRMTDILPEPPAPAVPGPTTESLQSETAPAPVTAPAEPQGRALADLYFAQGHYAEALRIYDDLTAANPSDSEVKRLRRDAEARLLPARSTPGAGASDPALERRLARIRALKRWLSVVQTG